MDMGLVEFVLGAATGVAGNAAYDGVKMVLGNTFNKLKTLAGNNDQETFKLVLQTAIESNDNIKQQLEQLRRGESITIVKQDNIYGDNIAGNKIVN